MLKGSQKKIRLWLQTKMDDKIGDKNVERINSPFLGLKKVYIRRRKVCPLESCDKIDYKNIDLLRSFLSEKGRILPARITSVAPKKQRILAQQVKYARFLALLPFVG